MMVFSILVVVGMVFVLYFDVDFFDMNFFVDFYLVYEWLWEVGFVVYFDKWNVYGVVCYVEVYVVLNDFVIFCLS